jgi:hypothetical protein
VPVFKVMVDENVMAVTGMNAVYKGDPLVGDEG